MSEQQIRTALRGLAEAPGPVDEREAWTAIGAGIARADRRRRRRTTIAMTGLAVAGVAAATAIVVASDDGQPVDTGPSASVPGEGGTLPAHPLAVVVQAGDTQRLDLVDADTGALVTAGLAQSVHSISDVSVTDDGTVLFTEEFGDSSAVRAVSWDGSSAPVTPYDVEDNETSSPTLSPDETRFAYVRQGVTIERPSVVVVDTATGERWGVEIEEPIQSIRDLAFSPSGGELYFTADGAPWVMDTTAEAPTNARPLDHGSDDFVLEGHFSADFEVIVLTACCGADLDLEQRDFAAVTLDGPGPVELPSADGVFAFDVDAEQTMALVDDDGALTLVDQLGRGEERAVSVGGPARDVGW